MEQLCHRHRLPRKTITVLGRKNLLGHAWPGNVRELSHELERAIVFEEGQELDFQHLQNAPTATAASGQTNDWLNPGFAFPDQGFSLEAAISRLIQLALRQTNQNVSAAARLLGVSRDYIRYRLSGQKPEGDSQPRMDTDGHG
jgi:DNA-binding NtrC family response regulator